MPLKQRKQVFQINITWLKIPAGRGKTVGGVVVSCLVCITPEQLCSRFEPWLVVFLGKILYPYVLMVPSNLMLGLNPAMD